MKIKIAIFVVAVGIVVIGLSKPSLVQALQARGLGDNAALQYYSAFLQMKDADLHDADVKELGEIIAGTKAYDDSKFGTLVESNAGAVETMMVGAGFSDCDWGLEALSGKLGWQTPVPYFWRARALGRLDILYALRAWGKGEQDKAVNALSKGMLFARHAASGGPLVPALIAKMLLVQQLSIVNRLADSGKFTAAQKETLKTALADLGSNGINWEAAVNTEMKGLKVNLDLLRSSPDQRQYLKSMLDKDLPSDFHGVTQQDYTDLAKIASLFVKVFRDDDAEPAKAATRTATSAVQTMIPNPERMLKSEQELKKALEETKAKLR